MQIEWLHLSQFIFVALALILSGLMLGRVRSRWLGIFFMAIGLHGAFARLPFTTDTLLDKYSYAIAFSYGPLIYFSLRNLLRDEAFRLSAVFIVGIPVFLAVALIARGLATALVLGLLLVLVQFISVFASFRELQTYDTVVEQSRSSGEVAAIAWVRSALWLYMGILALLTLRSSVSALVSQEFMGVLNLSVSVGIAVTLALMTYKILRDPDWIPRITEDEQRIAGNVAMQDVAPTEEQLHLSQQLNEFLRSERVFLDSDLSVRKLAEHLGWPVRQVSEVINRVDNCTFSQKINQLRVEEAKRLMQDRVWSGKPMLDIAMQSGFNSKSAFNLMFKRFSGTTPTEYRAVEKK